MSDVNPTVAPLAGVRVLDCSILEPSSLGALLGEMGADVFKVEVPGGGDYVRHLAWPVVEGISLLHWHANRGKRSIAIDLRKEEGVDVFLELLAHCDILIEGMRPGALARRGITPERVREVNPRVVYCNLSGFGGSGPYRDVPTHGIAFDAWAGVANPVPDDHGYPTIPEHTSIGTKVAPVWAAMGVLAALVSAERTGEGTELDVAQTDVAACVNWLAVEGARAYERPESEVTGNASDGGARRPIGPGGMRESVRYQYYASADGHVLFMASERKFWESFCQGIGRQDLFEARPGAAVADHAQGDLELREELASIFVTRTTDEWVRFGSEVNTPIAPVNRPEDIGRDPQFRERLPWHPAADHGADLLPSPLHFANGPLPPPRRAPEPGEHTAEILSEVLDLDPDRIAALVAAGAIELRAEG